MSYIVCVSAYAFVNHQLCEGLITERAKKWSISSIGSRVYWHLVFIGMSLSTETTFIWYFRCMCDHMFCKITILMKDLSHRLHLDVFSPECVAISICKSLFYCEWLFRKQWKYSSTPICIIMCLLSEVLFFKKSQMLHCNVFCLHAPNFPSEQYCSQKDHHYNWYELIGMV